MRILVLSQYFWPENFIVNDLVKQLVERGEEVCVLTGWPSYPERSSFSTFRQMRPAAEAFHGASILRVPMLARGKGIRLALNYLSFAGSASTIGLWKLRGRQFDVIFVFQPSPLSIMLPAAIFRRAFKAPAVLWVLDLWPETLVAMGILKGKTSVRIGHWLARLAHGQADYIFAQSRRMMARLQERVQDPGTVGYLPNWTVEESQNDATGPTPAWRDERFTIVVAGNMGDAQDFPSILDAVTLVSQPHKVHWVFVGDGLRKGWVAEQIEQRGLQGTVSLIGRVPSAEVGSHLQAADALLLSLRNDEVFSLTVPARLQTYLSSGRPVLGMIDGEAGELITEAGAGVCVGAGCSSDLARAVDAIMVVPKVERDRMGQAGKEFERKLFCREHWIDHLSYIIGGIAK
jgi:colanic acid biosynthesis glycosyl transferase WcaI